MEWVAGLIVWGVIVLVVLWMFGGGGGEDAKAPPDWHNGNWNDDSKK